MALRTDGGLWSWGYNFYGQLGTGTSKGSRVPVRVKLTTGGFEEEPFATAGT